MKTKINTRFTCIIAMMLITFPALAQQPQSAEVQRVSPQMPGAAANANYTYKVFQAPNKMYGYDILKDGKYIFHQPASVVTYGNSPAAATTLSTKENAEKAAQFSIDKIKKGQPAAITNDEIKKIITQ